MDKEERMFKSYLARKKRKKTKEVVKTIEKRKRADARNLKKKNKKIKKRQEKVLVSDQRIWLSDIFQTDFHIILDKKSETKSFSTIEGR